MRSVVELKVFFTIDEIEQWYPQSLSKYLDEVGSWLKATLDNHDPYAMREYVLDNGDLFDYASDNGLEFTSSGALV